MGRVGSLAFDKTGIDGWTTVEGQWAVEDMPGAPSGPKVFLPRATNNQSNVILAPWGPYSDLDVSMKFNPISGKEHRDTRLNSGRVGLWTKADSITAFDDLAPTLLYAFLGYRRSREARPGPQGGPRQDQQPRVVETARQ